MNRMIRSSSASVACVAMLLLITCIGQTLSFQISSYHRAKEMKGCCLSRFNFNDNRGTTLFFSDVQNDESMSDMERIADETINDTKRGKKDKSKFTIQSRIVAAGDRKLPNVDQICLTDHEYKIFEMLELIFHHKSRIKLKSLLRSTPTSKDELQDRENQRQQLHYIFEAIEDAGFEMFNQRDLDLCQALNSDYLLRLSLVPNLGGLDPEMSSDLLAHHEVIRRYFNGTKSIDNDDNVLLFDGKVCVFRRGYSEEITSGRLILPKIDYFQANLVQRGTRKVTDSITFAVEQLISSFRFAFKAISTEMRDILLSSMKRLPPFLSRAILNEDELMDFLDQTKYSDDDARTAEKVIKLNRYGGSNVMTPDLGDRITPFLYMPQNISKSEHASVSAHSTPNLSSEWHPICNYDVVSETVPRSLKILNRINIGNILTSGARKSELLKSLFKTSKLVEPTYEEVIVLWRPKVRKSSIPLFPRIKNIPQIVRDAAEIFDFADKLPPRKSYEEDSPKVSQFEIRVFERVTMANIFAVMPKTRLVFRPADALRIDFISGASFLAVLAQLRFDNPRLDLLALISVSFWILRTFFRYSNILARYDLVVKKFLTSKIAQKANGALRYIDNEASTQKALRVTLLLSWIDKEMGYNNVIDKEYILNFGKEGIEEIIGTNNIDINLSKTLQDLSELNLIHIDESGKVKRVDETVKVLQHVWVKLFDEINAVESIEYSTIDMNALISGKSKSSLGP